MGGSGKSLRLSTRSAEFPSCLYNKCKKWRLLLLPCVFVRLYLSYCWGHQKRGDLQQHNQSSLPVVIAEIVRNRFEHTKPEYIPPSPGTENEHFLSPPMAFCFWLYRLLKGIKLFGRRGWSSSRHTEILAWIELTWILSRGPSESALTWNILSLLTSLPDGIFLLTEN